jgi:rhodanese-related sulfurtransferase
MSPSSDDGRDDVATTVPVVVFVVVSRTSINDLVAAARQHIDNLTLAEAQVEIADDETLLIDVRDPRERWRDGSIPGAKHVTRGMLEFWADPDSEYYKSYFQFDRRTIVYCAAGLRSALAADTLVTLGFTDVGHIEGGFGAWVKAGLPVEAVEQR